MLEILSKIPAELYSVTIISAIIASFISFLGQYFFIERKRKRNIRHKRLINLLLPLYIEFNLEDIKFHAETLNSNGDPAGFLSELPIFYKPVINIIKKNIYLTDEIFTKKALRLINWIEVDTYDELRYDKIMTGKLDDTVLNEFKQYIKIEYKRERDFFLK